MSENNGKESKTEGQLLKEKLFYNTKNIYDVLTGDGSAEIKAYADGYIRFLDAAKTEREAVKAGIAMAEAEGYGPFEFGMKLEKGGKYYYNNRGKALYIFAIGTKPLAEGIHIMAAHVDSPRLDLKQNPLYENNNIAYFKTHYYGGIKKYQWTAIPMALHGSIVKADGSTVDVCIGEDGDDPVFYISDLLPHLAKDQMGRTLGDAITGESLNLIAGSIPYRDDRADEKVKLNVLHILNEKYGITEADFVSSELAAVPADKARYIGLDRSLIGGYGHDDRVCAYTELTGFFADKVHERTAMVILADKEETGSEGTTGMQSAAFTDLLNEIPSQFGVNPAAVRAASRCCRPTSPQHLTPILPTFTKHAIIRLSIKASYCANIRVRGANRGHPTLRPSLSVGSVPCSTARASFGRPPNSVRLTRAAAEPSPCISQEKTSIRSTSALPSCPCIHPMRR